LKSALTIAVYWLTDGTIRLERTFPGNIGDGIIRDAAVNNRKKTARIIAPFVAGRSASGF
jgi:hypothetical protein